MAKKKKKKVIDPQEKFPNGMYKERTIQALIQGGLLLVFLCGLGVFSYIVSMIPAGIFGIAITRENTTTQSVYDLQNIVLCVIGLAIMTVGGMILAKKVGEADALYAFQNKQERTMDKRYLLLSVAVAVLAYFIIVAIVNVKFFAGPIWYLAVFFSRAERRINEGIKVAMGIRCLAALVCLVVMTPFIVKGVFKGFREKMPFLIDEEEENKRREAEQAAAAEREAAEKAARDAERAARR
ncbi:MAG: hypothetical protein IK132_04255 [Clostridia bacterium]|nr:hypothetical protein [Clostridia bacterium]